MRRESGMGSLAVMVKAEAKLKYLPSGRRMRSLNFLEVPNSALSFRLLNPMPIFPTMSLAKENMRN